MLPLLLWSAFLLVRVDASPTKVRGIDIDNDPAPPADQGPAGSANADRNPANFKYDIIAIVGSYVVWTSLTVILILTVGRRLRRRAQASTRSLNMVRMKPLAFTDPSPISPGRSTTFSKSPNTMASPKSPGKNSGFKNFSRKSHKANPSEYSISTVNSYDESHRAKNMDQLADLYAAVMMHDEEKDARGRIAVPDRSPSDYYTPVTPQVAPELASLYNTNQLPHPMAPTPVDAYFPEDTHEPQMSRSTNKTGRSTPLSIISEISVRANELVSPKRPRRISIKNQRISQPMGSADLSNAHMYSDSTPLSPRLYNPGPPPPTPGSRRYNIPESESEQIQIHMHAHEASEYPQSRERRAPPSLALRTAPPTNSSVTLSGSQTSLPSRAPKALPFREVYGEASLRSAPPTKTTFLETSDRHHGPRSAMRTGVVPQTPYSPYMPFTPMTPITPRRLATREELKKQRKEERMKVLNENDLVADEGWGY